MSIGLGQCVVCGKWTPLACTHCEDHDVTTRLCFDHDCPRCAARAAAAAIQDKGGES
jgi:hypothetical protein